MVRAVIRASGLLLALGAAPAGADPAPFERCFERPGEPVGGTATVRIEAADRIGNVRTSEAQLVWQTGDGASRVLVEMLEPAEIRGSRVLLIAPTDERPQAWAYLPEIAAVKRVGERHFGRPLFGTTITYEDLERAGLFAEDAEVDAWTEASLSGRPVWRIETHAERDRITSWVDRERCTPLRTEVTDRKGRLARLVEVSPEPFDAGSARYVPAQILVRDVLDGSETRVVVEDYAEGEVALRFFDPERLAPVTTHAATKSR